MRWSLGRGRRQGRALPEVPEPPSPPVTPGTTTFGPVAGRYLASTSAGQWLDRISAHGLGVASRADLLVRSDGILITRDEGSALYLPAECLRKVRLDRSLGGNVYEVDGVVVITWRNGARLLDTGFRAVAPAQHLPIQTAVLPMVARATASAPAGGSTHGGAR